MSMKSLIILIAFVATIFAAEDSSEQEYHFNLLSEGFEFLIQHKAGITSARAGFEIFKKSGDSHEVREAEDFAADLVLENNWWTHRNRNSSLSQGDRVVFAVANYIDDNVADDLDELVIDTYVVPENATRATE